MEPESCLKSEEVGQQREKVKGEDKNERRE